MSLEFVDTNVLLHAYDPSAGTRHEHARELVGRLGRDRLGALSVQVLQEFYVNAVTKVAEPLSPDQARDRLRILSRWQNHAPLPHDVIAATEIAQQNQLSFWDAMIVRSAAAMTCSVLWTEDLNSGQEIFGVRVANPFG